MNYCFAITTVKSYIHKNISFNIFLIFIYTHYLLLVNMPCPRAWNLVPIPEPLAASQSPNPSVWAQTIISPESWVTRWEFFIPQKLKFVQSLVNIFALNLQSSLSLTENRQDKTKKTPVYNWYVMLVVGD